MGRPQFRAAALSADSLARQQGIEPEREARMVRRFREGLRAAAAPSPRKRVQRWGLVAAACAAIALAVLTVPGLFGPRTVGGFVITSRSAATRLVGLADGSVEVDGDCTLADRRFAVELRLQASTRVGRTAHGARVMHGSANFAVTPRKGEPYEVDVSHGVIRVVGTRFAVDQGATAGSIEVTQGRVIFVCSAGRSVELHAGERLAWPCVTPAEVAPADGSAGGLVPKTQPERSAPAKARVRRGPSAGAQPNEIRSGVSPVNDTGLEPDVVPLLERIAELRSRHLPEEAVATIASALNKPWQPATRERLSFERAVILTDLVGDRPRACAAWDAHTREFGLSHYAREIASARQRAGCPEREGSQP
jgi:hypothetical protein